MATISVLPSRKLVYVDLNVWERAGSGDTSTNKSVVEYSVVIKKGTVSWNTSWASWNTKIYASIYIDYLGSKTIYIPTYNYGGTCPPGTVIASGSFEVEHDSLGNRTIGFNLSFTDNADGNGNGSYYTPGDASTVYGSLDLANIPRYFSSTPSMTFKDKTETQIRYDWSTSEECDSISISGTGQAEITGLPGTGGVITITGLGAAIEYTHKGSFRKKDSQLSSDGPSRTTWTYDYPKPLSLTDFTIGDSAMVALYNPLARHCRLDIISEVNGAVIGTYEGESNIVNGEFATNDAIARQYASIPNQQSGTYYARVTYGSSIKTLGSKTYRIRGNETPTFNESNIINVVDTLLADTITGLNTKVIKGHNRIEGTIVPMTANNSAGGKSYLVTANAEPSQQEIIHNGSNKSFTFNNITANSFSVTAIDTRELATPRTKNIDLVEYTKPKVSNLTITRQNGIGEYAVINAYGTNTYWTGWSQIKKYNTIQKVYYRYKPSNSSNWSIAWTDITSSLVQNNEGNWRIEKTLDIRFTTTTKYDFQLYIEDLLESSDISSNTLSTANSFLWRDLLNKWLGINKKPECELDVNGTAKANSFRINGNDEGVWYLHKEIIDLSDLDQSTYYPVVADIPIDRGGLHRMGVAVQLNSGSKPTWSTHQYGFSFNLEVMEVAGGWGTTTFPGKVLVDTYNYSNVKPGWYSQLYHSSKPCFHLRGGGRYYVYSDYKTSWTVYTESTIISEQTVAPTTTAANTYVGINTGVYNLEAYPVGSIYMSTNGTDPTHLFGGGWRQIKGRFLVGTGSNEANDVTWAGEFPANDMNIPAGEKGGGRAYNIPMKAIQNFQFTVPHISGTESTRTALNGTVTYEGSSYYEGMSNSSLGAILKRYRYSFGEGQKMYILPPYLAVYMWERIW